MKITVDKEACIGCGLCASSCPSAYVMEDDGLAAAVDPMPKESYECARGAAEECPVAAISVED